MMEQVSLGPVIPQSHLRLGSFLRKEILKYTCLPLLLSHLKPSGQIPTKPTKAQGSRWVMFPNGQ